ncbi:MAG: response regulator [Thermoguttaceae bacterium]
MPAELATLPMVEPSPVALPKRQTVLIIDDDDTLSDVLSYRLKQQGFQTAAAYSGAAGVAKARAELPSAIILDLGLPDTDGLAVCEQLADAPETCSSPIIILSGKDEPGLVRRCRAAGCHYFLRKPHDPNTLLVLLQQAIHDTHQWRGGGVEVQEEP